MFERRAGAGVILSAVVVGLGACGDDVAVVDANAASCEGAEPGLVATLAASTADFIRIHSVGEHLYINIYDFLEPDHLRPGSSPAVNGQTWVMGRCGEDAVLVGEGWSFGSEDESLGTLTPVVLGGELDADPSLACDSRADGKDRIYRVDLTGASRPELLLEGWECSIDAAHMVTSYRDGEVHELWRVPNFPDLDGAERLVADVHEEVGRDAERYFYLDAGQALRAVDLQTGADEVLMTGVVEAEGGGTGSLVLAARTGPTRLLVRAKVPDEAEGMYLYRGETGEVVRLADVQVEDEGGWHFDHARTFIYHQPSSGAESYVRIFDVDGAPLVFPASIRAKSVNQAGVIGLQGPQWVFARPGDTDATVLDIPWDPELSVGGNYEDAYWYLGEELQRTPLDGGPTVHVFDYGFHYTENDALMQDDKNRLLHVDWVSNEVKDVLVDEVGAYALADDDSDGEFKFYGVFYTDISDPKKPGLWFVPMAGLPGGS